jgi:ribonuclease J
MFSSDPIPGNEVAINALIDDISQQGARVLYSDIAERIHVSGHGSRGDLLLMMNLVRPQYVIPIGGTFKHMIAYKELALKNGFEPKKVILPQDGQEIIFNKNGNMNLGKKSHLNNVYVDQVSGEEVETFVLRDREKISKEGIVVIMAEVDTYGSLADRPNIIARGFSAAETDEITKGLGNEIRNSLRGRNTKVTDWNYIRKTISNISEKYISQKLKRRPLVLPVVIEV